MSTSKLEALEKRITEENNLAKIADEFGDIKIQIAELEKIEEIYNRIIKTRLNKGDRVSGYKWSVLKSVSKDSPRLDAKKLEEDLGKDALAGYYKIVKGSERLTIDSTKLWDIPNEEQAA